MLSKRDFVPRYKAGEFGNASPTWSSPLAFREDRFPYNGLFHLRRKKAGGETHYNLSGYDLFDRWIQNPNWDQWYCSEMAPHHLNLIQGEVERRYDGLYLYYSTEQGKAMRDVLEGGKGKHAFRSVAQRILEHLLPPTDLEWLYALLDWYPGHVVEFSTFDREWGTVPGFQTIYWEVRLY